MTPRFLTIHIVAVGLSASAFFLGWLGPFLVTNVLPSTILLTSLIGLGSLLAGFGKWQAVAWLGDKLPVVGFLGTVMGIVLAGQGITSLSPDVLLVVLTHIFLALTSNFLGMFGYLWLDFVKATCQKE